MSLVIKQDYCDYIESKMAHGYIFPPQRTVLCSLSPLSQPPPPGHPPNAAQLAAMQGANVVMTQRKSNWFTGGSSGGYTIW